MMRFDVMMARALFAGALAASTSWANDDVLTQRNDPARSGAQASETILKPANVTPATFGRLYERHVDGQIIAQPLYVGALSIPGKGARNVVYVATRKNWIYAFDADDLDTDPMHGLVWNRPVQLEPVGSVPGLERGRCPETLGPVGINSTPVIDRASETMYVVARRSDGTLWLHALDITTGQPKSGTPGSVRISASVTVGGQRFDFDQRLELSRAALLFQNGAIFMGFGALVCDNIDWHGWLLAYRASDLQQVGVFLTSPNSRSPGAGIWQSGNGIVGDGQDIYFTTGNRQGGTPADSALDESFIKLRVGWAPAYGLTLGGKYTVSNREVLNKDDTDLGSGGPILLPGGRLVGGGKQGKLYVLNSATMRPTQNPPSGTAVPGGSDGFQAFINTWHDDPGQVTCTDASMLNRDCYVPHHRYEEGEQIGPNIHGGPIFWPDANPAYGLLYGMPEKDYLRAFRYHNATHTLDTFPSAMSAVRSPDGMPGAFLSLSANRNSDGIIWASVPKYDGKFQNVPGRLIAFDALTLNELWRDDDDIGFSKFNAPTVAGGKVFRPTFADKLIVYGLKSGKTPIPCYNIAQKYQNFTGPDGVLANATGPESAAHDGAGRYQHFQGGSIYWSPSTCAHEVHGVTHVTWANLGLEAGVLGYPITDESVTPDGIGHYSHFQHGSIYWTPLTGAYEVHGSIRDEWARLGWERSALGYPISDETEEVDGSGRFSLFEHGSIHWKRVTGTVTTRFDPNVLIGPMTVNVKRVGSDLANLSLPTPNPALCQQQCADNPNCQSWTYVRPGVQGPQAHCWVKAAVPVERADPCCVSGLKVQIHPVNMSSMEGTVDRPGHDFADLNLPDADPRLCQAECASNASCRSWTYFEAAGGPRPHAAHCRLKNSIPNPVENRDAVSGTKVPIRRNLAVHRAAPNGNRRALDAAR